MTKPRADAVSAAEFEAIFERVKNWGRWGADDQRGALNLITPAKRAAAAALVTEGVTVSASRPLPTRPGPNNPWPALRTVLNGGDTAGEGWGWSADTTTVAPHGVSTSHLDALCHIFWNRQMYNGFPAARMTSSGAEVNAIDVAREGIVSRGVLLDIPALLGKPYLDKTEAIMADDLEAAETRQGVRVEEGDILLVRTGRRQREAAEGESPWEGIAGLHVSTMPWVQERGVAVLGCDGISDVLPTGCDGQLQPVHACTIVAMGVHILDNLELEPLARACAERARWAFQLVVAPLIIERGTGSAVNPIAIF